ncbi:MAG: hypothetical protein ACT4PP_04930 [Sporichthyaceae bacterium]
MCTPGRRVGARAGRRMVLVLPAFVVLLGGTSMLGVHTRSASAS